MAFGFSGYLLPWNELSYFATRVGTDIAGSLPLIGKGLKTFILGGPEVSQATLCPVLLVPRRPPPGRRPDPHRRSTSSSSRPWA